MAKCFCGCDEPVKGLASRGHNKQGRRTLEQIEKLEALKSRSLSLAGDMAELEEVLPGTNIGRGGTESAQALSLFSAKMDEMIDMGNAYAETWHEILHDDYIPLQGAMNYKREWLAWGKASMSAAPMLKFSDEDFIDLALVAIDGIEA